MDTEPHDVTNIANAAEAVAQWYANQSLVDRVALLSGIEEAVRVWQPELVRVADAETGLGTARLSGESIRTAGQFRLMADVLTEGSLLDVTIDRAVPAGELGGPRPELRRTSRPVGPVAVYAASNFPLAFGVLGTDTAAALAAGCPVVAKAHPLQPETAALSTQLIHSVLADLDLPKALFQLVSGQAAGAQLITEPAMRAGAFTGSTAGGRALWDLACTRSDPIPFFAELGSVNPVVVTIGAAANRGAALTEQLITAIMLGAGQFCTRPGLLILPAGAAMIDGLGGLMREQPAQLMLGEPLARSYAAGVSIVRGNSAATSIATGAPGDDSACSARAQLWQMDACDALAAPDVAFREYFGPMALIVTYRTVEELEELVRALPGSLTLSIHAEVAERELAQRLYDLAAMKAGRVLGSGVPTGVTVGWAQHHGGPWPATTNSGHTSVGAASIRRFLRPVVYQDVEPVFLPLELQDANPLGLVRRIDGVLTVNAFS